MEDTKFSIFEKWLKDNGAKIGNTLMQNKINGEREVISKDTLTKGSNIVKIPQKLIITDKLAEDTYYGQCLLKGDHTKIHNLGISLVAIYILLTFHKKNPESFFKPYYDILPTNIDHFPIFWSHKKLLLLQGSNILNKIQERINSFKNDYNVIINNCPGFKEQFSFKQFVYVRTLIGSRNFGIQVNGEKRVAMIPYADMLNHSASPSTNWYYSQKEDCFKMDTNTTIQPSTEITDTYGKKNNLNYFIFYGFTLPNNDNNTITFNLKQVDETKNKLAPSFIGELNKDLDNSTFQRLLAFLRVSAATNEDLERNNSLTNFYSPINKTNEYNALRNLYLLIEQLERNYIKSRGKIKKLLKKTRHFTKEYSAFTYILGELEILLFYKNLASIFMEQLEKGNTGTNKEYKIYQNIINNIVS